jgi:hypothetical protein
LDRVFERPATARSALGESKRSQEQQEQSETAGEARSSQEQEEAARNGQAQERPEIKVIFLDGWVSDALGLSKRGGWQWDKNASKGN